MPKTRQQKEETLKALVDNFSQAKSAVFINFDKLTVADINAFRVQLRKNGLRYAVAKKTLLRKALADSQLSEVDLTKFERGVGTVFGIADEVAPAQTVDTFAKDHEAMTILGGIMKDNPAGQKFVSVEMVKALAKLPTKEVLLGQLVRTINAPVSGFVNVLAANLRSLVQVLNAVKDKKPAAPSA
jgi:large subunit ribosomal protein L10